MEHGAKLAVVSGGSKRETPVAQGEVSPGIADRTHIFRRNLEVAAGYWALAALVRWYFFRYAMWPAPIWLPAAWALFAVGYLGPENWLGIFVGSWLTNTVSFGETAFWGAIIAGGNALAPAVAARWLPPEKREEGPFGRVAGVLSLGKSAAVASAIAAAIGGSVVWWQLSERASAWPGRLFDWFLSDAAAMVLLLPLLLLFHQNLISFERVRRHGHEFAITIAILAAMVAYLLEAHVALPFLVLTPLLWVAVRFSARIAYPLFAAVMVVVIIATMAGYGPYATVGRGGTFLIFAQMAIGFGSASLLLGTISEQQRGSAKALRQLNQDLESRVQQRTAELERSKAQLEKQAYHDPLTGLPNRRSLEQRFSATRSAAARKHGALAVLLIDLDHFKQINDNIGHDAGDVILVETARRLVSAVREYDIVARMGGDEFAVLLPDVNDRASVDKVCARIVGALKDRIFFNGHHIVTSPSIGAAFYPEHGDLWQDLYKAADVALYAAKRGGRARWEWYEPKGEAAMAGK